MPGVITRLLATAWVAVGGVGLWGYVHNYYVYRGFAPPSNPAGVQAGRLVHADFRSAAFGGTRDYDIYLPPGYRTAAAQGRRFGVLYLLHGSPGAPEQFTRIAALGPALDTLVAQHRIAPMLVVMVDGRDGTFMSETEWADTAHGPYASLVLETVRAVDARWPTIADRGHRVLAGNSAGGYGAANLALRNPSVFGAFQSWSGYFTQTRSGVFAHATAAELAANSPLALARARCTKPQPTPVAAYVYGGSKDPDTRQIPAFVAALRACGGRVTSAVLPGSHDWRLWRDQLPTMLSWAATEMGQGR